MFRLEETAERFVVRPRGIPMWFAVLVLMLPLVGVVVFIIWFDAPIWMLPLGVICATMFLVFLHGFNCHTESQGPFLILDKARRILILPRLRVEADASHILGFVEVSAWHTTGDGHMWMAELSVLVRAENEGMVRYPVAESDSTKSIAKLGRKLADFFGIERKVIKLNWWTRRRLQAQSRKDAQ